MMVQKTVVNETKLEEMSQLFKVLADSNRLRIFEALMRGVSCNGWLTEELGLTPNLLSHHLKVLREAGLVQDRRDAIDGRWIYYQVNLPALNELYQLLAQFFNPANVASQPNLCGPEAAAGMGELAKPVVFQETAV